MTDITVAQLGASRVDPDTRLPLAQAKIPWGDDDSDAEDFGEVAIYGPMGVTCLPAPATDDGACEAVIARDVGGLDGVIIGARDERSAGVTAELKGGESCLHSTGSGYDSRVFCKDQNASWGMTRRSCWIARRERQPWQSVGLVLQIGKNGIVMSDPDGNYISLVGGVAQIGAGTVFLGQALPAEYVPVAAFDGSPKLTPTVLVPKPPTP